MTNSISYLGGADVMDRAQTQTPDRKGAPAASKRTDSDVSTSSTPSQPPPSPSPSMAPHARSKTVSHIDLVGQGKRLSLQFPIQPAAGSDSPTARPRSRPQSWVTGQASAPLPDTSETNILAVLAAQERYVLELKEELNKAEVDLRTLKKHYATHEASKRRIDSRKVAPMLPLNTSLANGQPDPADEEGSSLWMQREMERRKALLTNTRSSQRKVFSGSRHLRTLSLLSPDRVNPPSFPQPLDLLEDDAHSEMRPQPPVRSSTSSDVSRPLIDVGFESDRYDMGGMPNIQRENIIRAGTQMANDFKTGLFTFIEDLRQATVGDEAVNEAEGNIASASVKRPAAKSAKKPSDGRPPLNRAASSKKSVQNPGSFGDDFWKENGLSEPKTTAMTKKTHSSKTAQTPQKQIPKPAEEDEDWISWDTPNDTHVEQTADHQDSSDDSDAPTSPISGPGSSRTSTQSISAQSIQYHSKRHDSKASSLTNASIDETTPRDPKRNSIPWSDLVKLSPNNLKRTASHLMKEWEKQLTPPPESRSSNYSQGDFVGRSSSPEPSLP